MAIDKDTILMDLTFNDKNYILVKNMKVFEDFSKLNPDFINEIFGFTDDENTTKNRKQNKDEVSNKLSEKIKDMPMAEKLKFYESQYTALKGIFYCSIKQNHSEITQEIAYNMYEQILYNLDDDVKSEFNEILISILNITTNFIKGSNQVKAAVSFKKR